MVVTMPRWIQVLIILSVPGAAALAGEDSLRVYASSETVEVGQYFYVFVETEGGNVSQVETPNVEGLQLDRRPSIQESSFSSIMGKNQNSTRLGFRALALKEGVITIPAFTVTVDGASVKSDPVVVRATSTGGGQPIVPPGREEPEDNNTAQLRVEDVIFLDTKVDKTEVYVGEPVSFTLRCYRIADRSIRVSSPEGGIEFAFPETEGFYSIPERPEAVDEAYEDRGGRRYHVARWRQTLFATEPGELQIPAWKWNAVVQARTVHGLSSLPLELKTEPIDVTVKPLPPRPPSFNGAVGQYSLDAQVTPKSVKQNMPIMLIIRVNGTGNPAAVGEPKLGHIEDAHVSEPERAMQPITDPQGVTAETTFSYQITPLKPGSLAIPPVEFCYFDPVQERFVTEKTPAFLVTVEESGEKHRRYVAGAAMPSESARADMANAGMMPIVTAGRRLYRASLSEAGTAMVLAGPPLVYGLVVLWTARKRRFAEDRPYARSYRAKSRMRKRLRGVVNAADPADALCRAVNGYIADKFDLPEAGMTPADVRDLLEGRAIQHESAAKLLEILCCCERGRYGAASLSRETVESLVEAADANMECLDRWLEKESR